MAKELTREVEISLRGVSALRSILEHTKNMIDCYSLPSDEILKRVEPSVLEACGYKEKKPPDSFLSLAEGIKVDDAESQEVFFLFAKDFGKGYRADEVSRCSLYLEKMRAREQKLIKETQKKKKVIFTVAVCLALAVIILLI